ncbi:MAG TPA: hypothetical protein VEY70_06385 [Metabacillus sp.]|nr:hypothetical protein [Metabacillus sp.]
MLSDIDRKVLRIIGNFSAGRKRLPTIDELCIKTGRSVAGIFDVLRVLAEQEYIEWDRSQPDNIVLLEAWERRG